VSDEDKTVVELSADERRIIAYALEDQVLETERYLLGSRVPKTPGPDDSCCAAHLARYETRRDTYLSLKQKRRNLRRLIRKFSTS